MVKKLHNTCEPQQIVENRAVSAVNKLKWRTKQSVSMFVLTFSREEDIYEIYGITDILGMRVEIHPNKSSGLITQCNRCQA